MTALPKIGTLSPDEYLERERAAETKSEYVHGQIFAMAGASEVHNLLAGNLFAELRLQMRGRDCRVYINDMRVQVQETGLYTYPDVVAVCGERRFADTHTDTLLNPALLVEILSPSTEGYDRGAKFAHYRRLATLQEYVLVEQQIQRVEHYQRQGEQWLLTEFSAADDIVRFESIGCAVRVADIYENISFPPPTMPEEAS